MTICTYVFMYIYTNGQESREVVYTAFLQQFGGSIKVTVEDDSCTLYHSGFLDQLQQFSVECQVIHICYSFVLTLQKYLLVLRTCATLSSKSIRRRTKCNSGLLLHTFPMLIDWFTGLSLGL